MNKSEQEKESGRGTEECLAVYFELHHHYRHVVIIFVTIQTNESFLAMPMYLYNKLCQYFGPSVCPSGFHQNRDKWPNSPRIVALSVRGPQFKVQDQSIKPSITQNTPGAPTILFINIRTDTLGHNTQPPQVNLKT